MEKTKNLTGKVNAKVEPYRVRKRKERKPRKEVNVARIVFLCIVGIVGVMVIFGCFYIIGAGQRGVLLTFGKASPTPSEPGFHLKMPFAQKVRKMEVRTQKIEVLADSASRDLQDVQTTIALNYHVLPEETVILYSNVGLNYRERIIEPAIQESVRAITAKFNAEELVTKRIEVRQGIRELLRERLINYNIAVDDFNIVNFQFSEEFDKAIEEKVTAEQKKLKAERDLERIKIEKEQKITQAQAEAEALRLQKQVITDDLIKLRSIEVKSKALDVQLEAVLKWNGILPLVTSDALPLVGLDKLQSITQ